MVVNFSYPLNFLRIFSHPLNFPWKFSLVLSFKSFKRPKIFHTPYFHWFFHTPYFTLNFHTPYLHLNFHTPYFHLMKIRTGVIRAHKVCCFLKVECVERSGIYFGASSGCVRQRMLKILPRNSTSRLLMQLISKDGNTLISSNEHLREFKRKFNRFRLPRFCKLSVLISVKGFSDPSKMRILANPLKASFSISLILFPLRWRSCKND